MPRLNILDGVPYKKLSVKGEAYAGTNCTCANPDTGNASKPFIPDNHPHSALILPLEPSQFDRSFPVGSPIRQIVELMKELSDEDHKLLVLALTAAFLSN